MDIRMASHGYVRVGVCTPACRVADVAYNCEQIRNLVAETPDCRFFVFPELCVTAYTCGDLFFQPLLVEKARSALLELAAFTSEHRVTLVVGAPIAFRGRLSTVRFFCPTGKSGGWCQNGFCPTPRSFTKNAGFLRRPTWRRRTWSGKVNASRSAMICCFAREACPIV